MFSRILKKFKHIFKLRKFLFYLPQTIYFNFHYLPFRQAKKLPILLAKPKFHDLKGSIIIESNKVKFGMIKLGAYAVEFYPNTGIHIVNHGGTLIFRGKCNIGSGSTLWIGKSGTIDIGNNVSCWAQFKLISNIKISIGEDTRFGWDVMIMDNDFHKLTKVDGSGYSKGYAPVTIGKNCWFGNGSLVMKRSYLPDYTIVQARTIINRKFDIPPYSILGSNSEVIVKATGLWRNISDDVIEYPNI